MNQMLGMEPIISEKEFKTIGSFYIRELIHMIRKFKLVI